MSPLYGSTVAGNARALYPGDTFTLFNAELPTSGQASLSVNLANLFSRNVRGLALELIFATAPGAFNFQIQGADTDEAAAFFTEGTGTVTVGTVQSDGTTRARVELSPWAAKFMRLLCQAQTANGVAVTARVTVL